jgi:hypothetical protein
MRYRNLALPSDRAERSQGRRGASVVGIDASSNFQISASHQEPAQRSRLAFNEAERRHGKAAARVVARKHSTWFGTNAVTR